MAQAKTLGERELRIVLRTVATQRHAHRNRAMFLMSFWAGLRAGEIAALKFGDVVVNGLVTDRITLGESQTKGTHGRTVMVGEKLRKELTKYAESRARPDRNAPFFYSQRSRRGMSANTVAQLFGEVYRTAGVDGASSHSGRRTFLTTRHVRTRTRRFTYG